MEVLVLILNRESVHVKQSLAEDFQLKTVGSGDMTWPADQSSIQYSVFSID